MMTYVPSGDMAQDDMGWVYAEVEAYTASWRIQYYPLAGKQAARNYIRFHAVTTRQSVPAYLNLRTT